MLRSDYASQNCSVARALEVVGERWTLLIVRELLYKARRFSSLERRLPIAKNVLTSRLEKLVALGIVEKANPDATFGSAYQLTSKGAELFPVISALTTWGDAHLAPHGPPVVFEHICGHVAGHKLVCEVCGEAVSHLTTRGLAGPGWMDEAPTKPHRS